MKLLEEISADPDKKADKADAPVTPEGAPTQPETPKNPDAAPEKGDEESAAEASSADAPRKFSAFERGTLRMLGIGGLLARVEQSEAERFTDRAEIDRLRGENITLRGKVARADAEIAAAKQVGAGVVEKQVGAQLASLGIQEAAAPSQVTADATPEGLLEKFNTLKGAEKIAFFRANKADLKAAETAKTVK